MAIGDPKQTEAEQKQQQEADKAPIAKTKDDAKHLGVTPQKGAK